MRFWHKILLAVLVLFIGALDVSVVMVMKKSWQLNMASESKRAASEQLLITNNIYENLDSIRARGVSLTPALLVSVAKSYGEHYLKQGIELELRDNGLLLYPVENGGSSGQEEVHAAQEEHIMTLAMPLPAPYQHLELAYKRDISGLYAQQEELIRFFVMINWIVGPLLMVLLYLLIRHLTKPLKLLSETTKTIAEGNYSNRVELNSRDEFGELAVNFNKMAAVIEQRMSDLAGMAEDKQRMVDNLAHELRTPLTSMQGFAELLTTANIDQEDQVKAGRYILSETVRLKNLAFKLLDLSVLRHQPLVLAKVDVASLFDTVAQTEQQRVIDNGLLLEMNSSIPAVWGDADLLAALLVNLIENAIPVSRPGQTIRVLAYPQDGEGVLEVQDSGSGMTEEQSRRAFEPFYRADPSRSRAYGHAGLGLSLCRQIAEAHQARIELLSAPGEGTRIRLFLSSTV
ncbi:integral membrane sensor signal transduction histidine kinase [Paenibacillus sp. FSL R7-269]|uniref:sensor histidine kinase n=1 Tax=Paenibacillus sp. FSL R7-269 TaxID=1226755 RepID=UPI0003E26629|nr:HAMP domain-containing sensor histidine kinase [Paenibacillus sp. FSL R7-269]ETT32314.1 integral membrane sensor signal transduction histidine kinase [Paenibacillus sp. FSL R7-269]